MEAGEGTGPLPHRHPDQTSSLCPPAPSSPPLVHTAYIRGRYLQGQKASAAEKIENHRGKWWERWFENRLERFEKLMFARENFNSSDKGHFKMHHNSQVILNPEILLSLLVCSPLFDTISYFFLSVNYPQLFGFFCPPIADDLSSFRKQGANRSCQLLLFLPPCLLTSG